MADDAPLSAPSPNGNAELVVEDDGRVVTMYLHFEEETGQAMRGMWVRNRQAAPPALRKEDLAAGQVPLMPATHVGHPAGLPALDRTRCRVVWLPDGAGVGLYEGPDLVAAFLPGQPAGAAREAVKRTPLAEPMTPEIVDRFSRAQKYWDSWEDSPLRWELYREAVVAALEQALGKRRAVVAVDGGEWPPLAVAQLEGERAVALVTTGMSQRPLPGVEQATGDAGALRRVELGVLLPAGASGALRERLVAWLATVAAHPWRRYTWFGHGHALPTDAFGGSFSGALLADSRRLPPAVALPDTPDGDPGLLLWAVPATAAELEAARAQGSQAVLGGLTLPRALAGP